MKKLFVLFLMIMSLHATSVMATEDRAISIDELPETVNTF